MKASAVIAIQNGRVLMVRSRKRNSTWELPGGACLPDEGFADAAARELFEECGLRVHENDLSLVHVKSVRGWHVYIYQARRWDGELRPGDDAEACEFGEPGLLLTGERNEDYETVVRLMQRQLDRGDRT